MLALVGLQVLASLGRFIGRVALRNSPDDAAIVTVVCAVAVLGLGIAAALQSKRLAEALELGSPGAYMIGSLLPLVSIGVLFSLNAKATQWCRERGIPVGLFGPTS